VFGQEIEKRKAVESSLLIEFTDPLQQLLHPRPYALPPALPHR